MKTVGKSIRSPWKAFEFYTILSVWTQCVKLSALPLSNCPPYSVLEEMESTVFEAVFGKRYNLACVSIKDSDQPANPCSLIRVFDGRSMYSQGSNAFFRWKTKTLIRMCECADWFESSHYLIFAGAVCNVSDCRYMSDCRSRGLEFDPCLVLYLYLHGNWSWNNFYDHSPSFRYFKKG